MKKYIIIALFTLAGISGVKGQSPKASVAEDTSNDVIYTDYFANKAHFGIYLSVGSTVLTGRPYVPMTGDEYNMQEVAYGSNRINTWYSPGGSYTAGFEYQAKVMNRGFFIMDLGIAGYSYNVTVQDEAYRPNYNKPGQYDSMPFSYSYYINYTMAEFSVGYLYGIAKSKRRSLCVGAELHLSRVVSGEGPGYVISTSAQPYPALPTCLSGEIRYESYVDEHTLLVLEGYFTYGMDDVMGGLGATGVKIGLLF